MPQQSSKKPSENQRELSTLARRELSLRIESLISQAKDKAMRDELEEYYYDLTDLVIDGSGFDTSKAA